MKIELMEAAKHWGIMSLHHDVSNRFGLAWSVVKTVFGSRMPSYSLDKCKSGENALLIAYHGVESTNGLDLEMRALVKKQKREIIAAREWVAHFEHLPEQEAKQQFTAH